MKKPFTATENVRLFDRKFKIRGGVYVYDDQLEDDTGVNDDGFHWPAVGRGQVLTRAPHIFRYMHLMRRVKAKMTVLDAACGYAELARLMYTNMYGANYVGIDGHGKKLKSAIATGWGNSKAMFIQRDLSKPLPFADDTFDAVVSSEFIEHIPPEMTLEFLKECRRVVKPGREVIVTTPNGAFPTDNPYHIKEFTIDEGMELLMEAGLELKAIYGVSLGAHIREWDKAFTGDDSEAKLWRAAREIMPTSWMKSMFAANRPDESNFVTYIAVPEGTP